MLFFQFWCVYAQLCLFIFIHFRFSRCAFPFPLSWFYLPFYFHLPMIASACFHLIICLFTCCFYLRFVLGFLLLLLLLFSFVYFCFFLYRRSGTNEFGGNGGAVVPSQADRGALLVIVPVSVFLKTHKNKTAIVFFRMTMILVASRLSAFDDEHFLCLDFYFEVFLGTFLSRLSISRL